MGRTHAPVLPAEPVPNPSCDGHVHFEDIDLQFWVHFSRNDIERWRESATAARELILEWKVPP